MSIVFKKGYHVIISSYENDGDYNREQEFHFNHDQLKDILIIKRFLELSDKQRTILNHYTLQSSTLIQEIQKVFRNLLLEFSLEEIRTALNLHEYVPDAFLTQPEDCEEDDIDYSLDEELADVFFELYHNFFGYSLDEYPVRGYNNMRVYDIKETVKFKEISL